MKKLSLAALVLLAACGFRTSSSTYVGPQPYQGGQIPPDSYPDYLIDAGAAVPTLYNAIAVTTNGQGDYYFGWQGDGAPRNFLIEVFCPVGCDMTGTFANALPGDRVRTLGNNHIGIDAVTDASVRQTLTVSTFDQGGGIFPLTIDAAIDGRDAVGGGIVFSSGGQLATTDIMPFNIVPSTATFADQADLAPMFKIPEGAKSFTLQAPRPRVGGSQTEAKSQVVEASAKE